MPFILATYAQTEGWENDLSSFTSYINVAGHDWVLDAAFARTSQKFAEGWLILRTELVAIEVVSGPPPAPPLAPFFWNGVLYDQYLPTFYAGYPIDDQSAPCITASLKNLLNPQYLLAHRKHPLSKIAGKSGSKSQQRGLHLDSFTSR